MPILSNKGFYLEFTRTPTEQDIHNVNNKLSEMDKLLKSVIQENEVIRNENKELKSQLSKADDKDSN